MAIGGSAVDVGTGASVTFASGFVARLLSLSLDDAAREAIKTTYMGSTAGDDTDNFGGHTYIPGQLSDAGSVTMEIHFNPDTLPPIGSAAETFSIDFDTYGTDTENTAWDGTGFLTSMDVGVPLEDVMTATITVKLTSTLTLDPSVAA